MSVAAPKPDELTKMFAAIVEDARRHKNRELAAMLHVSEARVSQMLRSKNPTLKTMEGILVATVWLDQDKRRANSDMVRK